MRMVRFRLCLLPLAMVMLGLIHCGTAVARNAREAAAVPEWGQVPEADGVDAALPGPPLYWNVRLQMILGEADRAKHLELFLPISESRQTILRRALYDAGLAYRETVQAGQLLGRWDQSHPTTASDTIIYDFTVRIDGEARPLPLTVADREQRGEYLSGEPRIQVQSPLIRQYAAQLIPPRGTVHDNARALYDFVRSAVLQEDTPLVRDAAAVLQDRRGDAAGKARLLVALLRAAKIPARMVGGVVLRDLKRHRDYTYWVEAEVGGEWVEMDPARGSFGRVPNRYLAWFRGDEPLLRHTAKINFRYEFFVTQTSREAAEGGVLESLTEEGGKTRSGGNEKAIANPLASIVWISDRELAPSLVEKFSSLASVEQVKVSFLSIPYESKLFRGEQITDVIKTNDRRIRQADVLVIQTRDDAGLYALMNQGGRRGVFKDTVIYLNGDMYQYVANFFGHAITQMFHPKGLYIFPEASDPNDLWDLVYDNFLNGVPIADVAAKWKFPLLRFGDAVPRPLSPWRAFLVRTWVRAAQAGVEPQSLNLVLILPLISLMIVIYRGVIGFDTFGTFTPALICIAFLRTGIFWGVFLFLVILGLGTLLRTLLARVHVFLVARMALLIALVALLMLASSIFGIWWGVGPLVNVSVFPMVIMAGVIENFTRTHLEVGWEEAVRLSLSTLGVCVLSYFFTAWFDLESLVLVFPEALFVIMGLTVVIGLWRGLRLTELWKYYRVGKVP